MSGLTGTGQIKCERRWITLPEASWSVDREKLLLRVREDNPRPVSIRWWKKNIESITMVYVLSESRGIGMLDFVLSASAPAFVEDQAFGDSWVGDIARRHVVLQGYALENWKRTVGKRVGSICQTDRSSLD